MKLFVSTNVYFQYYCDSVTSPCKERGEDSEADAGLQALGADEWGKQAILCAPRIFLTSWYGCKKLDFGGDNILRTVTEPNKQDTCFLLYIFFSVPLGYWNTEEFIQESKSKILR